MKLSIQNPRYIISNMVPVGNQACYAPAYVNLRHPIYPGAHEMILTQGGTFPQPEFPRWDASQPWTDPNRGSDPIKLWVRRPGKTPWRPHTIDSWPHQGTNIVIYNHMSFPHMQDETYLAAHPESFIGATGGPCFLPAKTGHSVYFTATAGDPFRTTARQFTLYKLDLTNSGFLGAQVEREVPRDHSNPAVQCAELWFGDFIPAPKYPRERGITSVWALNGADGFTYLMLQVWTEDSSKNGLVRQRPGGDYEIWSGGNNWEPVINGRLPDWYVNGSWTAGNMFPWIIEQILETPYPLRKRGRYMLISTPDSEAIWYAFSDDLLEWGPAEKVEGSEGMSRTIMNPRLVNDGFTWLFASNDAGLYYGDSARKGQPTVDPGPYGGSFVCEAEAIVL